MDDESQGYLWWTSACSGHHEAVFRLVSRRVRQDLYFVVRKICSLAPYVESCTRALCLSSLSPAALHFFLLFLFLFFARLLGVKGPRSCLIRAPLCTGNSYWFAAFVTGEQIIRLTPTQFISMVEAPIGQSHGRWMERLTSFSVLAYFSR